MALPKSQDAIQRRLNNTQQPNQFTMPSDPTDPYAGGVTDPYANAVEPVAARQSYQPVQSVQAAPTPAVTPFTITSPTGQISAAPPTFNPITPVGVDSSNVLQGGGAQAAQQPVNAEGVKTPNDIQKHHKKMSVNGKNDQFKLTPEEKKILAGDTTYGNILNQLELAKSEFLNQNALQRTQLKQDYARNKPYLEQQQFQAQRGLEDAMAGGGLLRSSGFANDTGQIGADFAQQFADLLSAKKGGINDLRAEKINFMRQREIQLINAQRDAIQRAAAAAMGLPGIGG